jgi:hypothetical protein
MPIRGLPPPLSLVSLLFVLELATRAVSQASTPSPTQYSLPPGYFDNCTSVFAIPGNRDRVNDTMCAACARGQQTFYPCIDARHCYCASNEGTIPPEFVKPFTFCTRVEVILPNNMQITQVDCAQCANASFPYFPCDEPSTTGLCRCTPGFGYESTVSTRSPAAASPPSTAAPQTTPAAANLGSLSGVIIPAFPVAMFSSTLYHDRVPNAGRVVVNGQRWLSPFVSSAATFDPATAQPNSAFYTDFASAGFQWTIALCQGDSDDDGFTNGEELGDPGCVWTTASSTGLLSGLRYDRISHPGLWSSVPTDSAEFAGRVQRYNPGLCTLPARPTAATMKSQRGPYDLSETPSSSLLEQPKSVASTSSAAPAPWTFAHPRWYESDANEYILNTPLQSLYTNSCPHVQSDARAWHLSSTWGLAGIPEPGADVVIPIGAPVLATVCALPDAGFGRLSIPYGATLILDDAPGLHLRVRELVIHGTLVAGSPKCLVQSPITITLSKSPSIVATYTGGIDVASDSAVFEIHATTIQRRWARLAFGASVGDTALSLTHPVAASVGHTVVVACAAAPSVGPSCVAGSEHRLVIGIRRSALTSLFQLLLDRPLAYARPAAWTEVAVTTRRVLIRTDDSFGSTSGGFVKASSALAKARLVGVELRRLGRNLMPSSSVGGGPARYSFALDATLADTGAVSSYCVDCSCVNSGARCYSVGPATTGATLFGSVAFNATGLAFSIDPTAKFIVVAHCLVVGVVSVSPALTGTVSTSSSSIDHFAAGFSAPHVVQGLIFVGNAAVQASIGILVPNTDTTGVANTVAVFDGVSSHSCGLCISLGGVAVRANNQVFKAALRDSVEGDQLFDTSGVALNLTNTVIGACSESAVFAGLQSIGLDSVESHGSAVFVASHAEEPTTLTATRTLMVAPLTQVSPANGVATSSRSRARIAIADFLAVGFQAARGDGVVRLVAPLRRHLSLPPVTVRLSGARGTYDAATVVAGMADAVGGASVSDVDGSFTRAAAGLVPCAPAVVVTSTASWYARSPGCEPFSAVNGSLCGVGAPTDSIRRPLVAVVLGSDIAVAPLTGAAIATLMTATGPAHPIPMATAPGLVTVTGFSRAAWYLHVERGLPKFLTVDLLGLQPGTDALLVFRYPQGTSFGSVTQRSWQRSSRTLGAATSLGPFAGLVELKEVAGTAAGASAYVVDGEYLYLRVLAPSTDIDAVVEGYRVTVGPNCVINATTPEICAVTSMQAPPAIVTGATTASLSCPAPTLGASCGVLSGSSPAASSPCRVPVCDTERRTVREVTLPDGSPCAFRDALGLLPSSTCVRGTCQSSMNVTLPSTPTLRIVPMLSGAAGYARLAVALHIAPTADFAAATLSVSSITATFTSSLAPSAAAVSYTLTAISPSADNVAPSSTRAFAPQYEAVLRDGDVATGDVTVTVTGTGSGQWITLSGTHVARFTDWNEAASTIPAITVVDVLPGTRIDVTITPAAFVATVQLETTASPGTAVSTGVVIGVSTFRFGGLSNLPAGAVLAVRVRLAQSFDVVLELPCVTMASTTTQQAPCFVPLASMIWQASPLTSAAVADEDRVQGVCRNHQCVPLPRQPDFPTDSNSNSSSSVNSRRLTSPISGRTVIGLFRVVVAGTGFGSLLANPAIVAGLKAALIADITQLAKFADNTGIRVEIQRLSIGSLIADVAVLESECECETPEEQVAALQRLGANVSLSPSDGSVIVGNPAAKDSGLGGGTNSAAALQQTQAYYVANTATSSAQSEQVYVREMVVLHAETEDVGSTRPLSRQPEVFNEEYVISTMGVVGIGIGCFLVVVGVGVFIVFRHKRRKLTKNDLERSNAPVRLKAKNTLSSDDDDDEMLAVMRASPPAAAPSQKAVTISSSALRGPPPATATSSAANRPPGGASSASGHTGRNRPPTSTAGTLGVRSGVTFATPAAEQQLPPRRRTDSADSLEQMIMNAPDIMALDDFDQFGIQPGGMTIDMDDI